MEQDYSLSTLHDASKKSDIFFPLPNSESIHDEFLELCSDIQGIAKESGFIQNGEIPSLKDYSSMAKSPVHPSPIPKYNKGSSFDIPELDQTESQNLYSGSKKKSRKQTAGDKLNKGLRHFSLKVCQKVEKKKSTTYNEVADELVAEFNSSEQFNSPVDQKNIRRRVYDALNVLMAMNIISKEKKDIKWIGLPTNSKHELESMEEEKMARMERIKKKRNNLSELVVQQTSYKNLIAKNSKTDVSSTDPRIHLPFIIVNTRSKTVIDCEVADDRSAYLFNFSLPFEIHDDSEILKRMI